MLNLNTNQATGIRFGIIGSRNLDSDVVDSLLYGCKAVNISEREAFDDLAKNHGWEPIGEPDYTLSSDLVDANGLTASEYLNDIGLDDVEIEVSEPVIQGEHQSVHYRSCWLGGALMFWITESPVITHCRPCSPCVPNAGDLDSPDADGVEAYGVPKDWLSENFLAELEANND